MAQADEVTIQTYDQNKVQENDVGSMNEDDNEDGCTTCLVIFSYIFSVIFCCFTACCAFKTINQTDRGIVFRFGKLKRRTPLKPGFTFINPLIDEIKVVDIRTRIIDIKPQEIMTKDVVPLVVDGLFMSRIFDPIISITRVENVDYALSNLVQTSLRNLISSMNLSQVLESKKELSTHLMESVKDTSTKWGVLMEKIEIQNLVIPNELRKSMAVEAEAKREASAKIISAEGEKDSAKVLMEAAQVMAQNPNTMTLKYLQTLNAITNERGSQIIVFPVPIEMMRYFNQ
ncbi:MAG: hypothetical protein MHPSP_001515 [Paramarteilia canceri]